MQAMCFRRSSAEVWGVYEDAVWVLFEPSRVLGKFSSGSLDAKMSCHAWASAKEDLVRRRRGLQGHGPRADVSVFGESRRSKVRGQKGGGKRSRFWGPGVGDNVWKYKRTTALETSP